LKQHQKFFFIPLEYVFELNSDKQKIDANMYVQVIQPYVRFKMKAGKQYDNDRKTQQRDNNNNNAFLR
jgi:hypothetical protein